MPIPMKRRSDGGPGKTLTTVPTEIGTQMLEACLYYNSHDLSQACGCPSPTERRDLPPRPCCMVSGVIIGRSASDRLTDSRPSFGVLSRSTARSLSEGSPASLHLQLRLGKHPWSRLPGSKADLQERQHRCLGKTLNSHEYDSS